MAEQKNLGITGATRHRVGVLGKLVLQVEYEWRGMPADSRNVVTEIRWRDANVYDVIELTRKGQTFDVVVPN